MNDGIIAAGPWKDIDQQGCLPHRAVLRYFKDGEVCVHTQIQNRDGTCHFAHGDYFPGPLDIDHLKRAVAEMERRSCCSGSLPSATRNLANVT